MNISIIGTGYVGLVTGACFSEFGMNVLCMDKDEDKIHMLKNCLLPIYEPGLDEIVEYNFKGSGRLNFTSDPKEAVQHGKVIFITVNTPTLDDGSSDLKYVYEAAENIALYMNGYKLVVNKSTVPVGTGIKIREKIRDILKQQGKSIKFDIASNPEFLREGNAINDFIKPDRIVIGAKNQKAVKLLKEMYTNQQLSNTPVVITDIHTAEMIKYASNAFLATKISFMNEIANLCELCGADAVSVSTAMGLDSRIGPKFLNPGPGFGGSCFPKDIKALIRMGKDWGYEPRILESVMTVNHHQPERIVDKIMKLIGNPEGKIITILGISFKPQTDDIRESPSIPVIRALLKSGAVVKAYDPQAMENLKKQYPELNVEYCANAYTACMGSNCTVIMTEWDEFTLLDFTRLKSIVATPVLLDARNIYEPGHVKGSGFLYEGVGRK